LYLIQFIGLGMNLLSIYSGRTSSGSELEQYAEADALSEPRCLAVSTTGGGRLRRQQHAIEDIPCNLLLLHSNQNDHKIDR
jgi:hypothetical protein